MKGTHYERYHAQIERLYLAGVTVQDIATLVGTTWSALNAYLRSRGLVAKRQKHYVGLINEAASEMKKGAAS